MSPNTFLLDLQTSMRTIPSNVVTPEDTGAQRGFCSWVKAEWGVDSVGPNKEELVW